MKNLLKFETQAAFETAKGGGKIDTPCVSLITENDEIIMTTKKIDESDLSIGPWVDLGLPSGTMWASNNLGASSPCEYGNYYQWGSTTPTTAPFNWEKAPFNNGSSTYDKSYFNSVKDTVCPNGVLSPKYDAIYQSTGGKAKMPSKAEFDELLANTTHEYVLCSQGLGHEHEKPVYGELFTGKNGGKIFIPAAGYGSGSSVGIVGSRGCVWSSSLFTSNPNFACDLDFYSGDCGMSDYGRYYGFSVRGVKNSI